MAENIRQVIPNFELLAKVGEGAYGEVFLARSVTGQYRAVKIVYRDRYRERGGSVEAYEREFKGAKIYETVSRRHDALIDILHVGRDDAAGFFYYVMDAADDERQGRAFDPATYRPRTLRSELGTRTALPMGECVDIGIRLASALLFLQENGLVHRDVKPSNVVFVDGKIRLADVGLVADVREAKSLVGTPGFEPPEHHGSYSGDVYSLGKLLYEVSTGRDSRNFGEAPSDEADTEDPRFALFNRIVQKACARHFQDRYQTAKALLKALEELAPVDTVTEGRGAKRASKSSHRTWIIALSSLGVICVAALLGVIVYHTTLEKNRFDIESVMPIVLLSPLPLMFKRWPKIVASLPIVMCMLLWHPLICLHVLLTPNPSATALHYVPIRSAYYCAGVFLGGALAAFLLARTPKDVLLTTLRQFLNTSEDEEAKTPVSWRRYLSIGAAALLLVFVIIKLANSGVVEYIAQIPITILKHRVANQ